MSFRSRLLTIEDDYLNALAAGDDALDSFIVKWEGLDADLRRAAENGSLNNEDLQLAYSVASMVSVLTDGIIQSHSVSQRMFSVLETELIAVFEKFSLLDAPSVQSHNSSVCPPYISYAYKWLLKNLHNPYPSKETKEAIAKSNKTSRDHVDAWFISARRRIGWTAIVNNFFDKSRPKVLDAAHRALVEDDPTTPLAAEIRMAFIEMESTAKNLYSAKLKQSALAGKLDMLVKDMTEEELVKRAETKAKAAEEEKRRKGKEKERQRQRQETKESLARAIASYPSPQHSPRNTPEPAIPADDGDDLTPSPPMAGKKRRSLSPDIGGQSGQPNKRFRSSSTELSINQSSSLLPFCSEPLDSLNSYPSPPCENDSQLPTPSPSTPSTASMSSTPVPSTSSRRKRRLSESDLQGFPKRSCHLSASPRPQAVSHPLLTSSSMPNLADERSDLDSWLKELFAPPVSVTMEVPDPSIPLDIEVFDFASSQESTLFNLNTDSNPSSFENTPNIVLDVFPSIGQYDLPIELSAGPIEANVEWSALFGNADISDGHNSTPNPQDILASLNAAPIDPLVLPATDSILNSLDGLSSLVTFVSALELPKPVEISANPVPVYEPAADIDWFQLLSFVTSPVETLNSDFCRANPPSYEADSATFPLPTTDTSSAISDGRAEKLRKLREYQDKARELERELLAT